MVGGAVPEGDAVAGKAAVERDEGRAALGRRPLLDRALIRAIAEQVRKEAFLHVAAEASGVSRRTLFAWLERGRELEAASEGGEVLGERDLLLVELLHAVSVAHAEARIRAEAVVLKKNPLAWLRFGPGRDRGPEDPGWTRAVGEVPVEVKSAAEELLSEALRQLGLGEPSGGSSRQSAAEEGDGE